MIIVGVGAGPNLITQEAISAIEKADIIFGSSRALELADEHIRCERYILTDYTLQTLPENAVILSTGDPMLSGLGKFAKTKDKIIPGISSLQIACARLHVDIDSIYVITAHSRDIDPAKKQVITMLREGKSVYLIPGSTFGSKELGKLLEEHGIRCTIFVCQRLNYPDERIIAGTVENPPSPATDMYCIVITPLCDRE